MAGRLLTGLLAVSLCAILPHVTPVMWSLWTLTTEQDVVSYDSVTSGRSALDCVIGCSRSEGCMSAAFDVSSRLCYLQPVTATVASVGNSLVTADVYSIESVSGCTRSDAPTVANADVSAWRASWGSFEGDVTCHANFMFDDDDDPPKVRCQAGGAWQKLGGNCLQRIWTQVSVAEDYMLPQQPTLGWSACLTATLITNSSSSFEIFLKDADDNHPLQMLVWLGVGGSARTTVLSSLVGSVYGPDPVILVDPYPAFPFVEGQKFTMTITAAGINEFEVHVDGAVYGLRVSPLSISTVTRVQFQDDIDVHLLNLWCC